MAICTPALRNALKDRQRCTGESWQDLRSHDVPVIPPAEHVDQAELEAVVLVRAAGLSGLSSHPLGIRAVRPEPHRLTILLLNEPYVASWWTERLLPVHDPSNAPADAVNGIPGLRYEMAGHGVRLFRPGRSAEVLLTGVRLRSWQRCAEALVQRDPDGALFTANDWRPAERAAHEFVGDSAVGSALLRRIRATAGPGPCNGTDVWRTAIGGGSWEVEMTDGPACVDLLPLLTESSAAAPWSVERHSCHCGVPGGDCSTYLTTLEGDGVHLRQARWGRLRLGERAHSYRRSWNDKVRAEWPRNAVIRSGIPELHPEAG
ncbi:hypothetical protein RKD27_007887 [Streptomyces sp. SAI-126]